MSSFYIRRKKIENCLHSPDVVHTTAKHVISSRAAKCAEIKKRSRKAFIIVDYANV